MVRPGILALLAMAMTLNVATAFQTPCAFSLRRMAPAISAFRPSFSLALRGNTQNGVAMMGTILANGELALTEDECEKLKMPPNSVVPKESVEQFQKMLQDIDDDNVRKLARQIGTNPEEEPYPGYFQDIERLGLKGKEMTTSSSNPASLYGPDGKAYAPWMVGKVSESVQKKERKPKSADQKKFEFNSRGQELSGVGLSAALLGDEVRLTWTVEGEQNSKGYIVSKRPGGTDDAAWSMVADYKTPGAMLEAGRINGQYSYVDGQMAPGVWVYRVQEEDVDGSKTTLSQTIIDVPSNADKIKTLVAAAVLGSILTGLTVVSVMLDPQTGITSK